MQLVRWPRYEIENYLLNPAILKRFIDRPVDLLTVSLLQTDRAAVDESFAANFPAQIDWLSQAPVLRDLKGSDFLVNVLSPTSQSLQKRDLYMVAAKCLPEEIHEDVRSMLDRIAGIMPSVVPVLAANASPEDANGVTETSEQLAEPKRSSTVVVEWRRPVAFRDLERRLRNER